MWLCFFGCCSKSDIPYGCCCCEMSTKWKWLVMSAWSRDNALKKTWRRHVKCHHWRAAEKYASQSDPSSRQWSVIRKLTRLILDKDIYSFHAIIVAVYRMQPYQSPLIGFHELRQNEGDSKTSVSSPAGFGQNVPSFPTARRYEYSHNCSFYCVYTRTTVRETHTSDVV